MSEDQGQQPEAADQQAQKNEAEQLKAAREHADCLTNARPKAEEAAKAIHDARIQVDTDIDALQSTTKRFEGIREQAQKKSEELQTQQDQLQQKINTANESYKTLEGLIKQLEEVKTQSQKLKEDVEADAKAIKDVSNNLQSLEADAKGKHDNLQNQQNALNGKIKQIDQQHQRIQQLSQKLFEDKKDENGTVTEQCVESKINTLHEQLNTEIDDAQKERKNLTQQFAELKDTLEAEIRSLLPNAATAALAHGYVESKSRYGSLPYDEKAQTRKSWYGKLWHYIKGNFPNFLNHAFFFAPLVVMAVLFIELYQDIQNPDLNETVLLFRALIAIPLAVMSWFGWKAISLNRRLYEEYNHKQRVMQLYHGFKKEVDKHGDEEMQKALMAIMLDVVKDKPSLTMTQYDRGPEEFMPRSIFASMVPFVGKKDAE